MADPNFSFEISDKVRVHVDLHRKRVVIACETNDGKSVHLETTYKALDQLYEEIRKQLDI